MNNSDNKAKEQKRRTSKILIKCGIPCALVSILSYSQSLGTRGNFLKKIPIFTYICLRSLYIIYCKIIAMLCFIGALFSCPILQHPRVALQSPLGISFFSFYLLRAAATARVQLELQPPACTTATATPNPSCVCDLHTPQLTATPEA